MSSQNTFPWDSLKAETLRSIVHDLGIPVARSLRKREGMIKVLISVTEKGLEKTIEEYQEIANNEQAEEKVVGEGKPKARRTARMSTGGMSARSTRNGRNTGTFDGVVLPSGTTRSRRPSAKAKSSQ